MELWIRSQDKNELCKVNRLFLGGSEEKTICATVNETIGVTFLGGYKTKERALEVLDEIQEYINSDISFNLNVYEMPKE